MHHLHTCTGTCSSCSFQHACELPYFSRLRARHLLLAEAHAALGLAHSFLMALHLSSTEVAIAQVARQRPFILEGRLASTLAQDPSLRSKVDELRVSV